MTRPIAMTRIIVLLVLSLAASYSSASALAQVGPGLPHVPAPAGHHADPGDGSDSDGGDDGSDDGGADEPVFPELSGDALLAAVAQAYGPVETYPYDRARDTLFAAVHLERARDTGAAADSLRGLYSGHAIWLDPALDPTTAAWNAPTRVSTEHLWPQNRGATEGTDAHQDMHHLAPVMQSVNSSRSDHPFGEIVDDEADRWWGPDGVTRTSAPPLSVRDLYSEKLNAGTASRLEPREAVAGDVARALFYVWAVYGPPGADQLDTDFWATQRDVLLTWHRDDPADQDERDRSREIARHQGTENPFVVDATLATRAFGTPPAGPGSGPHVALASLTATATGHGDDGLGTARVAWSTTAQTGIAAFRLDARPDRFGGTWSARSLTPAEGTPTEGAPAAYAVDLEGFEPGTWRVRLTAIEDSSGNAGAEIALGDVGLVIETATDDHDGPEDGLADPAFVLEKPRPNPATARTTAALTLARPARVRAVVTDVLGREVAVALDEHAGPGRVEIRIDTTTLAPGLYVLRVTGNGHGGTGIGHTDVETHTFTVAR